MAQVICENCSKPCKSGGFQLYDTSGHDFVILCRQCMQASKQASSKQDRHSSDLLPFGGYVCCQDSKPCRHKAEQ